MEGSTDVCPGSWMVPFPQPVKGCGAVPCAEVQVTVSQLHGTHT